MIPTILLAFITLITIGIIHHYEAKINKLNYNNDVLNAELEWLYQSYHSASGSMYDYKRAFELSKHHSNTDHYTHLQLENSDLHKTIKDLDTANMVLQEQIRQLKQSIADSRPIQYESNKPYINPYNNPLGI